MPTKTARLNAIRHQIARLDSQIADLQQTSDRFMWARVIVFGVGLVAAFTAYFVVGAWLFWLLLAIFVVLFVAVIHRHRTLERSQRQAALMRDFKQTELARAETAWDGLPPARITVPRYDHPFEGDLDIVGDHSLHHLLDTTVSIGGCDRLRAWLSRTEPDRETTVQRQALVAELAPRSLFRLRLWLGASDVAAPDSAWQPDDLIAWLQDHHIAEQMRPRLILLSVLAVLNLIAVATSVLGLTGTWWPYTFALYFGVYMALSRPTRSVFHEATALQGAVAQLAGVVGYLETYGYGLAPQLRRLCAPFLDQGTRPSRQLGRIKQVAAATGIQGNPVIWFLLNAALPWDYFFAYQLNRYKADAAEFVPRWLDIWAELEALSALANLAYLNPGYTLPTFDEPDANSAPVFSAIALGHPLLPDDERICNDFAVAGLGDIAILTGSNMAGKSTFLKTVGINLVLAYAGGPVTATQMHSRLFRLFTCIKVSDSVTDGISYFYAEVKRLKALLAALEMEGDGDDGEAERLPLFFCIDEIFRGTNNRERLEGSRAYIRELTGKHGTGLISTHDLDLAQLAHEIEYVRNYHFRDAIVDERMAFDYRLRTGPCPTTNALKIMAMEGLPVPGRQ